MQLDQSRIAICERSWLDNLDLALQVIRVDAARLAAAALAGIVPLAVLNYALLSRLPGSRFSEAMGSDAYFFALILAMIEAPLATAPLTLYLGQALFSEKPKSREIVRDFVACLPQLLLLQVVVRAIFIIPIVSWIVPYVIWPYLNEVILLERNPLVGRGGQISTLKRNSNLHRNNSGEFLLRGLAALGLAPLLIVALWATQRFLLETLLGYEAEWTGHVIAFQAVLWTVLVWFSVARFLSYLDQRIRNEGWEVELFLRAERERLARQVL
jgi:hypothetical protein